MGRAILPLVLIQSLACHFTLGHDNYAKGNTLETTYKQIVLIGQVPICLVIERLYICNTVRDFTHKVI